MISPTEANERESRFFVEVLRCERVWLLQQAGGLANFTDDGDLIIPVWSCESASRECASESFADYEPVASPLPEFLASWLPALVERVAWVAVDPTADLAGNQLPADLVLARLRGSGV